VRRTRPLRDFRPRLVSMGLDRRQALALGGVLAAGLVLRLAFLLSYRPGFLGDPDSGSYIDAAHYGLFNNVYDPAGYPVFIRLLHLVDPHLSALIVVQHLLGLATAGLLALAVVELTGSVWIGLVPACVVLFDGYGLWVEHTPLTETLFRFLVVAILALALRLRTESRWSAAGVGALVAASAAVRPMGLTLGVVIVLWLLLAGGGTLRQRVLPAVLVALAAVVVTGGYVLAHQSQTGFTGLTRDAGRVLYAQAGRFADCADFTPPTGTRALCEPTPRDERGSFNQYLTGFPDHPRAGAPINRAISPAWRVFGPPPGGESKLRAFALAAILHQPGAYIDEVTGDFHYYWSDHHLRFIDGDATVDPQVQRSVVSYYDTAPGVDSGGLGWLRWYGRTIQLDGVLVIVLLLLPLTAILVPDRRVRAGALLFAFTGWALPVIADAAASVDPRFILPSYGLLAAASAIGVAAVIDRGRRRYRPTR
jgi:hypothetical protein